MAAEMAQDAVTDRLVPICVAQFNLDPGKDTKLAELRETSSYRRSDYIGDQGWATLPGEARPDRKVAAECAKMLMEIGQ
jgi:hypothetical protein